MQYKILKDNPLFHKYFLYICIYYHKLHPYNELKMLVSFFIIHDSSGHVYFCQYKYMYLRSFIWCIDLCQTLYCIGCTLFIFNLKCPSIIIIRFWKYELCIQSWWMSNYRNFLHNTFVDQFLNKIHKKTWCKMLFYKIISVSAFCCLSPGASPMFLFESREQSKI